MKTEYKRSIDKHAAIIGVELRIDFLNPLDDNLESLITASIDNSLEKLKVICQWVYGESFISCFFTNCDKPVAFKEVENIVSETLLEFEVYIDRIEFNNKVFHQSSIFFWTHIEKGVYTLTDSLHKLFPNIRFDQYSDGVVEGWGGIAENEDLAVWVSRKLYEGEENLNSELIIEINSKELKTEEINDLGWSMCKQIGCKIFYGGKTRFAESGARIFIAEQEFE